MAAALNFTDDAKMFFNRSRNFKNTFSPLELFFCPRDSNGSFHCPLIKTDVFDPRYVEGDAWHYRFNAPHDVKGLIELFGSSSKLIAVLNLFLELSKLDPFNTLPNPYYWAGNEEDLFDAWIFSLAGEPSLTQKYTAWLRENKYTAFPDGIPGNDDYGTMSSWFIFSALGFYPLSATTTYVLGTPLFEKLLLQRKEGDLLILANNLSKENIYVSTVTINGISVINGSFDHSQIANGGTIVFNMSNQPTKSIFK